MLASSSDLGLGSLQPSSSEASGTDTLILILILSPKTLIKEPAGVQLSDQKLVLRPSFVVVLRIFYEPLLRVSLLMYDITVLRSKAAIVYLFTYNIVVIF